MFTNCTRILITGDNGFGDGLQSIIVITYRMFTATKPCAFFIEEPELFLHPGLQRRVLERFAGDERHLFWATTHSNHLLDMSADFGMLRVFQCRAVSGSTAETGRFALRPVDRTDRSSLYALGIRNSSVFMVNATIWVEGVTDRAYLRAMLRLYFASVGGSRFLEDRDYAFVEYGGSNVTHWSFARSARNNQDYPDKIDVETLCGEAFLICDDDGVAAKPKTAKHDRISSLAAALGERFAVTAGREIENMLPAATLRAVVLQRDPTIRADELLLERRRYRSAKLGSYLDAQCQAAGGARRWSAASGTIADKVDFSEAAVSHLARISFSDLDSDVQALIVRIARHISRNNADPPSSR